MAIYGSDALGGSPAAVPIVDTAGRPAKAMAMIAVDAAGGVAGTTSHQLASNLAIPANSGTQPVTIATRGVYVWDAQWTGAGTLALQALGADGATWRTIVTLAGPGAYQGEIRIGAGAIVRLFNQNAGGGAAFTAAYASLS